MLHDSSPSCPVGVSFTSYAKLYIPFPCTWLSHAQSTMNVSDSHHSLQPSFVGWVGLPASTVIPPVSGTEWVSQVLIISLDTCHAQAHRQTLQSLTKTTPLCRLPLRLQCRHLHLYSNDAESASGTCVSPVTYTVLCVRFTSVVPVCRSRNRWQRSVRGATLDTGGWLSLQKSVT